MDTNYSYFVDQEDRIKYIKAESKNKCDSCQVWLVIILFITVGTLLGTMGYFIHQKHLQEQAENISLPNLTDVIENLR